MWTFAKALAQELALRHPQMITAEYRVAKRPRGRVLVDYNQNAWDRTLASVYSVRPEPSATVSTPVTWKEIEKGLRIEDFTVVNVPARLKKSAILEAAAEQNGSSRPEGFPMTLPLNKKYAPMEALPATELPKGPEWQYEPKWDGFRCLAFRENDKVDLQSKSGKPLTRYFPELAAALLALKPKKFVLDGEIVIPVDGHLSFDELLMRIHPAASRVLKLSQEQPCVFIVFDLLVDENGKSLVTLPLKSAASNWSASRNPISTSIPPSICRQLPAIWPRLANGFTWEWVWTGS